MPSMNTAALSSGAQGTLVGLFKEVYAGNIVEAWQFMAHIANRVDFVQKSLQNGRFYNQPVDLKFEHGITAAAASITPGEVGGPTFLPPSAGQMENAQVAGAQLIGRSSVSYEAIARSANDKAAFKSATAHVVRRLSRAVVKRLELQLLHGKVGLGVISANPATGASRTVVITDASWSAGIWAGEIGATVDLYNSAGVKQNTGSTATSNAITITSVNTATKSLTLSVPLVGDQSINLLNLNIFFETASPASEMAGLDFILSTTPATADLFGIPPTSYDLWCSNQVTGVGTLTFSKLVSAMSQPAVYGLSGKAIAVVSPKAFEALNADQAALRRYDVTYSEARAKNGVQALVFLCQTGEIEIMAHPFAKDGDVLIFVPEESRRVGATDVTFIKRQGSEDKLILESATSAGSEMRCYSNQALFVTMPRHCVKMSGITY